MNIPGHECEEARTRYSDLLHMVRRFNRFYLTTKSDLLRLFQKHGPLIYHYVKNHEICTHNAQFQ